MFTSSIRAYAISVALLFALNLMTTGRSVAQHSGAGSSVGGMGASPTFSGGSVGGFGASPTYAGGNLAGFLGGASQGMSIGPNGFVAQSVGGGFGTPSIGNGSAYPSSVGELFGYPGIGTYAYPAPTNVNFHPYAYNQYPGRNGFAPQAFSPRYAIPFVYAGYANPFGYGNGYVPPGPTYSGSPGLMDPTSANMATSDPLGFGYSADDGSTTPGRRPPTRRARRPGGGVASHREDSTPLVPLDQLLAEDGKVRWPAETPRTPELESRLTTAERAISTVAREYRARGRVTVRGIALARGRLSDFAGPALKRLKVDSPDQVESFALFVKNLDRNLRVMGTTKPLTAVRRAGANLGVNPDGTSKLNDVSDQASRPGTPGQASPTTDEP